MDEKIYIGVDMANGKDMTVYSYQSPEPLYTRREVVEMVMGNPDLKIDIRGDGGWYSKEDKKSTIDEVMEILKCGK